jgi:hypothetical protein
MLKGWIKNYFGNKTEKEPWQIAAARYCVTHSEGFTKEGLVKHIEASYKINALYIEQFYNEEIYKPAGREHTRTWIPGSGGGIWTPPLDLVSKITSYDELQEARESSREAMRIATGSFVVAILVGIIQILISIFK